MIVQPNSANFWRRIPVQLPDSVSPCQSMQYHPRTHFDKQNVPQEYLHKSERLENYPMNRKPEQSVWNQHFNSGHVIKAISTNSNIVQQPEHFNKSQIQDKKVCEPINTRSSSFTAFGYNNETPQEVFNPNDSDPLPNFLCQQKDPRGLVESSSHTHAQIFSYSSEKANYLPNERHTTFSSNTSTAIISLSDKERFSSTRTDHPNGFQDKANLLIEENIVKPTRKEVPSYFYGQPSLVSASPSTDRHSNSLKLSRFVIPLEHAECEVLDNLPINQQIASSQSKHCQQLTGDQHNQRIANSISGQVSDFQNSSPNGSLKLHDQQIISPSIGECRRDFKVSTERSYHNNLDRQFTNTAVQSAFVPSNFESLNDSRNHGSNRFSKTSPYQYSAVGHTQSTIAVEVNYNIRCGPGFASVIKQPSNRTLHSGTSDSSKLTEGCTSNNTICKSETYISEKHGVVAEAPQCSTNIGQNHKNSCRPISGQNGSSYPIQPIAFANYNNRNSIGVMQTKQINNYIPVQNLLGTEKHSDTISLRLKSEVKQTSDILASDIAAVNNASILQKWDPIVSDKKWEEWQNSFNTEWNAFLKDLSLSENLKRVYR